MIARTWTTGCGRLAWAGSATGPRDALRLARDDMARRPSAPAVPVEDVGPLAALVRILAGDAVREVQRWPHPLPRGSRARGWILARGRAGFVALPLPARHLPVEGRDDWDGAKARALAALSGHPALAPVALLATWHADGTRRALLVPAGGTPDAALAAALRELGGREGVS